MQAILQRDIYRMIYIKEGIHYQQGVQKWISKSHKVFPWFERIILKTLFSIYEGMQRNLGSKCIPCCQNLFLGFKSGFLQFYNVVLNCRKFYKLVWNNSESKCKSYKGIKETEKNKRKKKKKKRKGTGPRQPSPAQPWWPNNWNLKWYVPSLLSPNETWSPPISLTPRPHCQDSSLTSRACRAAHVPPNFPLSSQSPNCPATMPPYPPPFPLCFPLLSLSKPAAR
jgi:hypothetical protein